LSIWATGVSAISYMAIPAKTYAFDWSYISLGIWPVLTTFIAAYLFIPLLRKLEILSITQYMEMRFNRSIRIPITILTILGGILGRLSTVLLLPSLALSAVTGWKIWISIVSMGVVTTVYTVAGGMNAVVWTDVAQTVVMFGGVLLSFALIVARVDGGISGVIDVAMDHHKLRMFDFAWDFSVATFWVFILWAFIDLWGKIGQEGLQRAFSTKDVKSARRAMITCAWVSVPGTILFYGIGTALYAFYAQHPDRLNPNLQTDGIFPLFIMQQLPAGLAGLVIAGIFAAAMSTLSGMNSAATIVVQDFCDYFAAKAADHKRLVAARLVTVLYGAMATGGALWMSTWKISSIWDTFSKVMSLMGGGLGCVMVLGLLTRRSNTFGVWVGTLVGTIMLWSIELFHWPISFFIYGTIATVVASVTGYLASVLTGGSRKDLTGLTLWTLKQEP
jgi:SSS family transporter